MLPLGFLIFNIKYLRVCSVYRVAVSSTEARRYTEKYHCSVCKEEWTHGNSEQPKWRLQSCSFLKVENKCSASEPMAANRFAHLAILDCERTVTNLEFCPKNSSWWCCLKCCRARENQWNPKSTSQITVKYFTFSQLSKYDNENTPAADVTKQIDCLHLINQIVIYLSVIK